MGKNNSSTSEKERAEKELARKIRFLKMQGLGYRRIGNRLGITKDKAFRLDHKYNTPQEVNMEREIRDEEIAQLDELEAEIERKVRTARERRERRRRVADLLIQEADADFQVREHLFENKKDLLAFGEKVLPVVNPPLWVRLKKVCAIMEINFEDALEEAIGPQAIYEQARMKSLGKEDAYLLDQYLCDCLESWLAEQEKEISNLIVTFEGKTRLKRLTIQVPSRVLESQRSTSHPDTTPD